MFFFGYLIFGLLAVILCIASFFMFDEIVLKGYFATKLRKRFNVDSL